MSRYHLLSLARMASENDVSQAETPVIPSCKHFLTMLIFPTMLCVPDASPLILLAKVKLVHLLPRLYGPVVLTPWVWQEAITRGMEMSAIDAAYLSRTAGELQFNKLSFTEQERQMAAGMVNGRPISTGQVELLAACKGRKALAILDDRETRALAVSMDIPCVGMVGVLFEAYLNKLLDYDQLLEPLEYLGNLSCISPDLMAGIAKRARELNKK